MGIFNLIKSRKYKNNRLAYYAKAVGRELFPDFLCRILLASKLRALEKYDADYIHRRVDYYNKLSNASAKTDRLPLLSAHRLPKRIRVYYFDSYEYTRFFSKKMRLAVLPGDITHIPEVPSIVKSRPVGDQNQNSVLLKLDKVRHFMFVRDQKPFAEKKNRLVFRGAVTQPHRKRFLELYFGHPLCDVGQTNDEGAGSKYLIPKMSIDAQLDYKFILSLEGNDVATNLKWIMSSNSVAVMSAPKFETWFMEGTLIPNFHYILIKDDFSDLKQQLNHYIEHPDEAEQIARNANEYVRQFQDKKREDLISLLVLNKYFRETGQTVSSPNSTVK